MNANERRWTKAFSASTPAKVGAPLQCKLPEDHPQLKSSMNYEINMSICDYPRSSAVV
jgi:hypothetical protein